MDVVKTDEARAKMDEAEKMLNGIELVIINAGVGFQKATYGGWVDRSKDRKTSRKVWQKICFKFQTIDTLDHWRNDRN